MKKYTKQIVSGVVLFILGGMIIPVVFVVLLFTSLLNDKPLAKFTIPGQAIVTIEKHGRYYLWNDYQTVFEGRSYSSSEELPGRLEISLLEKEAGDPIEFVSSQSITSSSGDSHKNSVGYFEVDEPGSYILSVFGETEPRVCSFSKSFFNAKSVLICMIAGLLEMVMGIGGFVLIVIGVISIVKDYKQKKAASSAPSVVN